MNDPHTAGNRPALTRREMLLNAGTGFGALALSHLLGREGASADGHSPRAVAARWSRSTRTRFASYAPRRRRNF